MRFNFDAEINTCRDYLAQSARTLAETLRQLSCTGEPETILSLFCRAELEIRQCQQDFHRYRYASLLKEIDGIRNG